MYGLPRMATVAPDESPIHVDDRVAQRPRLQLRAALRIAALAGAITAFALPIVARIAAGPRGGVVHVRWVPSVDAAARQQLEARFRLADGEALGGSTWRYDLVDPTSGHIRDLVRDPSVEDTHHIDRSRFTLDDTARTARRGHFAHGSAVVAFADRMAIALAIAAALLALYRRIEEHVLRAEPRLRPYALLTALALAVYAVALWFPPTNGDDLAYLASVAATENPLSYFVQDAGAGGQVYRPLLPTGMWVIYRLFGVWALPNQLINLALHMLNVFLLYRIVHQIQPDKTFALLIAAVFMISKFTFMAATWTSDRPMVLAGLCLLLLIGHLSQSDAGSWNPSTGGVRLSVIAAVSVLAVISKESGIVVPAVALVFALAWGGAARLTPGQRAAAAVVTASIIGLYIVFRRLIFGAGFASYTQDGFMFFGLLEYEDGNALPRHLLYINYAENVIKNALAPVLPVFGERGSLLSWDAFLIYVPVILATVVLFVVAVDRRLSRLQWMALAIILVNAVVHFALFRSRLHYLSHAAFCLFVAGSPWWRSSHDDGCSRLVAAKTFSFILLVGGILWTSHTLDETLADRVRAFEALQSEGVKMYGPVVEEVLLKYR
jgi:hypothetical protein